MPQLQLPRAVFKMCPSLAVALPLARWFGLPVEAIFSLDPFLPLTSDQLSRRTS